MGAEQVAEPRGLCYTSSDSLNAFILRVLFEACSVMVMLLDVDFVGVREAQVELSIPWTSVTVRRSMPALKFYYDLDSSRFGWYLYVPRSSSVYQNGPISVCLSVCPAVD